MEAVLVMAMVLLAGLAVGWPLLGGRVPRGEGGDERLALETARDAKLAEIRDAELDLRTGKLSQEDFEAVDAELRAEAVAILRRLDAQGAR